LHYFQDEEASVAHRPKAPWPTTTWGKEKKIIFVVDKPMLSLSTRLWLVDLD